MESVGLEEMQATTCSEASVCLHTTQWDWREFQSCFLVAMSNSSKNADGELLAGY
jgi:hypothetical protein